MVLIASITLGLAIARLAVGSPVADANPALITPGPALHRRDYAPDFVGYALWDDGNTDTYTCGEPFTYTYESGYAGCCSTSTDCTLSRYCFGSTLVFEGGSSSICDLYCVTQSVFYSTDDSYPASIVQCDETSYDLTILRTDSLAPGPVTIEVTVTPSSTRPISTTEPVTSSSSSSISSSTSTTPIVPTAPLPAQTSSAPKKSIAPIVGGAVGGAVVLIALVGIGLFFFFKKRSQNSSTPAPGGFGNQHDPPAMASPMPSNYNPYSPPPNMAQAYPSPVSSPAMSAVSPYQTLAPTPAPYSPPPVYGNEKSASVTMAAMPTPHSEYEYRLPDNTAEVHGISAQTPLSSPPPANQAPRNGATELA
ncbi:hypothetical protein BDV96DRAFT_604656 [Lophiotrema nucula]|uniref:Mid2 domain-containing protein n=1 Tax=Lophiotrema nucula TaxID=690887 RepID=A0A6A5YRL2_9PLEO|nr:hypothetical protein BDV96DRAFT_604656 [Lophiotrema nucula]